MQNDIIKKYPELNMYVERLIRTPSDAPLCDWMNFIKALENVLIQVTNPWVVESLKGRDHWEVIHTFPTKEAVDHFFMGLIKTIKQPDYDFIFQTFKGIDPEGTEVYLRVYNRKERTI